MSFFDVHLLTNPYLFLSDLWKKAFISRWPLMMRLQNVYSPSWRLAFASQTRREHDIATIFSEHNLLPSKHIPADPEYKGIANGAPAEPLQDSFRLACITENDESQKVFRRIATVFRGVQIVTQSGVRFSLQTQPSTILGSNHTIYIAKYRNKNHMCQKTASGDVHNARICRQYVGSPVRGAPWILKRVIGKFVVL